MLAQWAFSKGDAYSEDTMKNFRALINIKHRALVTAFAPSICFRAKCMSCISFTLEKNVFHFIARTFDISKRCNRCGHAVAVHKRWMLVKPTDLSHADGTKRAVSIKFNYIFSTSSSDHAKELESVWTVAGTTLSKKIHGRLKDHLEIT